MMKFSLQQLKKCVVAISLAIAFSLLYACAEGDGGLYGTGNGGHARAAVYRIADIDELDPVCSFDDLDINTAQNKTLELPKECLPVDDNQLHIVTLQVAPEYMRDEKTQFVAILSAPLDKNDEQTTQQDTIVVGLTDVSEEIVKRVKYGQNNKQLTEQELVNSLDLLASDLLQSDINDDGTLDYQDVLTLQGDKATTDALLAEQASSDAESFYRYHIPLIENRDTITPDDIVGLWALVSQDFQYSTQGQPDNEDLSLGTQIGRYREFCHIEHISDNRYSSPCFSLTFQTMNAMHTLELVGNTLHSLDGNIQLTVKPASMAGHANFEEVVDGTIYSYSFNKVYLKKLSDNKQNIVQVNVNYQQQDTTLNADLYAEYEATMTPFNMYAMDVTFSSMRNTADNMQFHSVQIRDLIPLSESLSSAGITAFLMISDEQTIDVHQNYETPFDPSIFNRYITASNELGMPLSFTGEDINSGDTATGSIDWLFLTLVP